MLQKAWLRGAALSGVSEILTVTNRDFFFKTEDEYREMATVANKDITNSFILEPFGRNTAPAIAAAALQLIETHGEQAILLVLAADHLIHDELSFAQAVTQAVQLSEQNKLVVFGIKPEQANTGYGYIEATGHHVHRFIEKPNVEKAQEYVDSGRYLWNSGMFCFTAGTLLRQMEQHCPAILAATRLALTNSRKIFQHSTLDAETFKVVPADSLDYALLEKSLDVAVVPCHIGWSDIGSWTAFGDLIEPDKNGNRLIGETQLHKVNDCYIQSQDRLIGAIGIRNLIIVDTHDALLIADKNCAEDVKQLYTSLKSINHEAHKLHHTVHRPWGTYTVLEQGQNFKIKRIEVKPGAHLSLQMHQHRSEHWIVVSGCATVINGEQALLIKPNESTFIPAGNKHRLANLGDELLVIIEVQSGAYLAEDDIVRFDDLYGRALNQNTLSQ